MTQTSQNPYVGPRTFSRAEGERFFGREREARDLLARVISERLVLFYAQSGAGKSSLINTRLTPQLQAAGFAVLPVGRVSGALPAGVSAVDNIFVFNLLLSLDQSRGDPGRFSHTSLSHFLARLTSLDGERYHYEAGPDTETLQPVQDELYEAAPSVLIIDQFEEIATTHPEHWPQRAGFFQQLDQAMTADPLLWVVLSLREDYIAALEPYAYLLADKLRARFFMQRMGYEAALEAIEQPARLGSRPFAADVAQTLANNLGQIRVQTPLSPTDDSLLITSPENSDQPSADDGRTLGQYIEPVQLQVVCYQLWENLKERSAAPITIEDLETLGNVDTALAEFYEQALQKTLAGETPPPAPPRSGEGNQKLPLSSEERGLGGEVGLSEGQLRTWFDQKLITEAGTRGTVYQGTHETAGLPNPAVRALADQFLLRAEIRAGGTWYELVHDRFIEPIQQANRAWREQRLRQNPLLQAAQSWLNAGRDPAKLYQGQQLKEALAGLDRTGLEPLAQEFLEASEEAQRQRDLAAATRQAQVLRYSVGGLGLVLLVVIGVAIFAWSQRRQAEAAQQSAEADRLVAVTAQAQAISAQQSAEADRLAAVTAQAQAISAQQTAEAARTEAEQQRLIGRANQLAAQSQVDWRDGRAQRSLLMALEALTVTLTQNQPGVPSAEQALREALMQTGERGLSGHKAGISAVAFSPDGHWLASGSADSTARLWNVQQLSAEPVILGGHTAGITTLAFSPDGHWLATGSEDTIALVWNVQQLSAEPTALKGHKAGITTLAFSPDGRWLVTGSRDKIALLWNVQQLSAEPVVLRRHKNTIFAVAFSPDGRWLVTGSEDNTALLWDIQQLNAKPRAVRSRQTRITVLAFSPDSHWLATGNDDATIGLWDVQQPQKKLKPVVLQGHGDAISALVFSPDGHWLTSGSADKTVRLWDMQQPNLEPAVLQEREARITALAFSPDSHWLATGSRDNTIARLWNVQQPGTEPVILQGQEAGITALAFSPDGRWLATGNEDATARLWNVAQPTVPSGQLDLAKLMRLACVTAGRNLSEAEWAQFFPGQAYRKTCPDIASP